MWVIRFDVLFVVFYYINNLLFYTMISEELSSPIIAFQSANTEDPHNAGQAESRADDFLDTRRLVEITAIGIATVVAGLSLLYSVLKDKDESLGLMTHVGLVVGVGCTVLGVGIQLKAINDFRKTCRHVNNGS